jgi:hypothetical protein
MMLAFNTDRMLEDSGVWDRIWWTGTAHPQVSATTFTGVIGMVTPYRAHVVHLARSTNRLNSDTRRPWKESVTIWECEFRSCILVDATLQAFVTERQHPFTKQYKTTATTHDLLTAVNNDTLFGMVEVDIHVPNNLYQKISEMSPPFVTTRVPFSSIGSIAYARVCY